MEVSENQGSFFGGPYTLVPVYLCSIYFGFKKTLSRLLHDLGP